MRSTATALVAAVTLSAGSLSSPRPPRPHYPPTQSPTTICRRWSFGWSAHSAAAASQPWTESPNSHTPSSSVAAAPASGRRKNAGVSWHNITDGWIDVGSIGAVEVADADPSIIYVGSGSADIRGNVSVGRGTWRSRDGGETWEAIGLRDAGQVARIRTHPTDPNTVWLAATGNPFGRNDERGVFKSTDGGDTWRKVLFHSDSIGAIDLALHPTDSEPTLRRPLAGRAQALDHDLGGTGRRYLQVGKRRRDLGEAGRRVARHWCRSGPPDREDRAEHDGGRSRPGLGHDRSSRPEGRPLQVGRPWRQLGPGQRRVWARGPARGITCTSTPTRRECRRALGAQLRTLPLHRRRRVVPTSGRAPQ